MQRHPLLPLLILAAMISSGCYFAAPVQVNGVNGGIQASATASVGVDQSHDNTSTTNNGQQASSGGSTNTTPTTTTFAPVTTRTNAPLRSSWAATWTKAADLEAGDYRITATGSVGWSDGSTFASHGPDGFMSSFKLGNLDPQSPSLALMARIDYLDGHSQIVLIGIDKVLKLLMPGTISFSVNAWKTLVDMPYDTFGGGYDATINKL